MDDLASQNGESSDNSSSTQSAIVSENLNKKRMNKRTKTDPKILDGKYFSIKLREGDKIKAICAICGKVVSGSATGTGNFTRHINDKHAERSQEMYNHLANKLIVNASKSGKLTQVRLGASPVISNTQVYF